MDTHGGSSRFRPDTVELLVIDGLWFVRVIENSSEAISPGFERESFAVSFAEGQCVRLGLPEFRRV